MLLYLLTKIYLNVSNCTMYIFNGKHAYFYNLWKKITIIRTPTCFNFALHRKKTAFYNNYIIFLVNLSNKSYIGHNINWLCVLFQSDTI